MRTPVLVERYGRFSRIMHWLMAALLLIQFLTAASHFLFEDTALEALLWPVHKPLGALLFVLILIRLAWMPVGYSQRPPSVSKAATAGHALLYALMLFIPSVALLRQYGSGRAFEPLGIPVFPGFSDPKIDWMVELGNNFHGILGWSLLVLALGHVFMVFWHRRTSGHVDVLPRMWR